MLRTVLGVPKARVHIGAFLVAAVATPFLFAALGLAFMGFGVLITAYAAILGLPAMVLLGLPGAYLVITRRPRADGTASLGNFAMSGLAANLLAFPLGLLVLVVLGQSLAEAFSVMLFYCSCGLIAAPIQALIFGCLYQAIAPAPEHVIDEEVFC